VKSAIFNHTRRGFEAKIGNLIIFFIRCGAMTYVNSGDTKKGNFRIERAGSSFCRGTSLFWRPVVERYVFG